VVTGKLDWKYIGELVNFELVSLLAKNIDVKVRASRRQICNTDVSLLRKRVFGGLREINRATDNILRKGLRKKGNIISRQIFRETEK